MERKVRSALFISAASGLLIVAAGLSGCSMFSPTNQPVDCNIVKQQVAAGQSDAQIATNLSAQESEVAACHGPETTGNTNTIVPEKGY
jgi:hypothetical protein